MKVYLEQIKILWGRVSFFYPRFKLLFGPAEFFFRHFNVNRVQIKLFLCEKLTILLSQISWLLRNIIEIGLEKLDFQVLMVTY